MVEGRLVWIGADLARCCSKWKRDAYRFSLHPAQGRASLSDEDGGSEKSLAANVELTWTFR